MLTTRDVIDALILGFSLATVFGMGPAFFTLVQTSISRGVKPGLLFALGVAANDILMIVLCIMTSVKVVIEGNEFLFGLAAGVILILFGLFTYRRKAKPTGIEGETDTSLPVVDNESNCFTYIMKGFALNILNPFVWIFWIGTVALVSVQMEGNRFAVGSFFAITMGVSMMCDVLKAYGASAFKRFFNSRRVAIMNKITGIILMLFGIYFILKTIFKF